MEALKQLLTENYQEVEYLRLEKEGISDLSQFMPLLVRFPALAELNLGENQLTAIPADFAQLKSLKELNLNGNPIADFKKLVDVLASVPSLDSLHLNLHEEDQVDLIIRALPQLQFLNGLKIDREELEA